MDQFLTHLSTDDFDYDLPVELIADQPVQYRDQSRLLVMSCASNEILDQTFVDIEKFLQPGDLLVLNDTKVFPARLFAYKESGGKVEIFAERLLEDNLIKVQLKSNRTPKVGSMLQIDEQISAQVCARDGEFFTLKFNVDLPVLEIFERHGHVPLPPYIQRSDQQEDISRYQTVYAENIGAVAAPTAGLHFTQALLQKLTQQGVQLAKITLHVGAGTFKPVKVDDPSQHKMHSEFAHVTEHVCEQVRKTKSNGCKVVAVGTTCVRALESAAASGAAQPFSGETTIFIYPGYTFKVVDALITNFHLPKSTLIMLVSALAGHEKTMHAYQHAVKNNYRFYSYGDAMLILP